MHKRMKQLMAALLCLTGCAPAPRMGNINHWAAYYDDTLPASAFKSMDLVVFDRRHYPKFDSLKGKTIVLAYVSIGEVYDDVPERKRLEKEKSILNQNDKWGSHVVDITSPLWRKLVMGYVDDAGSVKPPFIWDENRRRTLRAKLDAVFFHLYGITNRDDVRYIYSTFPIVEREEQRLYGTYRSRDLCLAYMNALAAGNPDAEIRV